MNKNELKILQILAEIQNPDKIITDMASDLIYLATEKASQGGKTWTVDEVKKNVNYYMKHLHDELDKYIAHKEKLGDY